MISIVAAVAENLAIGKDNTLLWHLSEDLKRFKKITDGGTIIMGRKTFESLPGILPNRTHIVVTKNSEYRINDLSAITSLDLESVIEKYKNSAEETFIIGGSKIFDQTISICDKMYLTFVKKEFNADVYFPEIPYDKFKVIYESEVFTDKKSSLSYQFKDFIKYS